MEWIIQVFMISLVGMTFLIFSGKFASSIARVDLNGDDSADIEGTVSGKLQQGAGLGVGALAGGVGAAAAGGSIMRGAAVGGLTGSKGGKPGSAALLGMAAGKASSVKTKEKQAQKEHENRMKKDPVYANKFDANKQNENAKALKDEDKAMMNASARYEDLSEKIKDPNTSSKERKTLSAERDKIADEWVKWSKSEDNLEVDSSGKKSPRKIPTPPNAELASLIGERAGGDSAFRPLAKKVQKSLEDAVKDGVNEAAPTITGVGYKTEAFKGFTVPILDPSTSSSTSSDSIFDRKIDLQNLNNETADSTNPSGSRNIHTTDTEVRHSMPLPMSKNNDGETSRNDSGSAAAAAVMTATMAQVAATSSQVSDDLKNVARGLDQNTKQGRPPTRPGGTGPTRP